MKSIQLLTVGILMSLSLQAFSDDMQVHDHGSMKEMAMPLNDKATTDNSEMTAKTAAEVRKVDQELGKVTLKHGDIKNLGMPGMTMVFKVKDPMMLKDVAAGEKVMFTAERINGDITVTSIEKVMK